MTRPFFEQLVGLGARIAFRATRAYCAIVGHRWSRDSAQAWLRDGTPIRCERCGAIFEPYVGMR